jgi:Nucleotidyltransferase of unknown function (DUF6036)
MPFNYTPEPWNSFFTEIEEVVLHCLGGFVMTILYGLDRPTADVDVLPVGSNAETASLIGLAGQGSTLHKKYKVYLQVVGVAQVPINYEDRLTEMFPGSFNHLRLFALDPYDLALSKLERNTQRDRDDVKHLARTLPLDLNLLQERYQTELRPDLGNPGREDLTLNLWIEVIEEERKIA